MEQRIRGRNTSLQKMSPSTASNALVEDGTIVIAIENQLGLKYFLGSGEDHCGKAFRSPRLPHFPFSRDVFEVKIVGDVASFWVNCAAVYVSISGLQDGKGCNHR